MEMVHLLIIIKHLQNLAVSGAGPTITLGHQLSMRQVLRMRTLMYSTKIIDFAVYSNKVDRLNAVDEREYGMTFVIRKCPNNVGLVVVMSAVNNKVLLSRLSRI
jgi:hypothetical protein